MRAQRAPLRPTFSSARLCHVVHVALLYFTEEWSPADDPKNPSLNSTPGCLKVIDTFRALACFFHDVIGLPHGQSGSAFRVCPANYDFSQVTSRGCRYSLMFRPPSLLARQIVPTAADTAAGQPGRLRPSLSSSLRRTGYASRPNTGN